MTTNERDTHFQGFAKLQYPELARLFLALYSARVMGAEQQVKQAEQFIQEFLAQCAYDLVSHALFCVYAETIGEARFPFDLIKTAKDIPDMTVWPE